MITKKHLKQYQSCILLGYDIFNINIIYEIMSNDDVDHIKDNRLLAIANLVKECYLKDDWDYPLSQIVNAVLLNYKDITEQNLSPREILKRYI